MPACQESGLFVPAGKESERVMAGNHSGANVQQQQQHDLVEDCRLYGRELSGIGDTLDKKGHWSANMDYERLLGLFGYTSLGFASGFFAFVALEYVRRKLFKLD